MYFLLSNFLDNILRRSEDRIQVMTWGYGRAQEVLSMVVQLREGIVWKITCIVLLLLGLFLGGCGKVPNTFEIRSDTDPSITVTGEATRYTLVDDGRVLFTANDSTGDRNIVLDPDDIVIERPIANAVTVLTQANRLL
jgi:hypothetical protein